jgi:hypothetical protein
MNIRRAAAGAYVIVSLGVAVFQIAPAAGVRGVP